jgi:hypothetical protein
LRTRTARSFDTITDFSNCATAPSTCRINVRVGSSSPTVKSVPESAAHEGELDDEHPGA